MEIYGLATFCLLQEKALLIAAPFLWSEFSSQVIRDCSKRDNQQKISIEGFL